MKVKHIQCKDLHKGLDLRREAKISDRVKSTADRWHLCKVNQEKQVGLEEKVKDDTGEYQQLASSPEVER